MVDTRALRALGPQGRAGSNPAPGTFLGNVDRKEYNCFNVVFGRLRNWAVVILGLIFLGGIGLYYQSSLIKNHADDLMNHGRAEVAIEEYKKAHALFPWRRDIADDIEGARLVVQSTADYSQVTDVAEFQEVPDLTHLPALPPLKPNELFVPILMYHHIRINPRPGDRVWAALNVTPLQLDEQLAYLASHNYQTITLDQLYEALNKRAMLPDKPIILSFDDGYRTFYDNAFPILRKYQMKAVEFVITQVLNIPAYLTWDEIGEMDKSGLVEFGAHTRHHPNLPELSAAAVTDEVTGSKTDLESHLKKPIYWFAYPYGSYSQSIIKTVQQAGFKGAVSTIYGSIQSSDNIYLMPRIMVDGRFSLDDLVKRINRR